MEGMVCVVCERDPIVRLPVADRNRVVRPDGTPVFLCPDCVSLAQAGQLGAFTNGALLRLKQLAPLFGIDLTRGATAASTADAGAAVHQPASPPRADQRTSGPLRPVVGHR